MEEGPNGRDEVHNETEPLLHQVQRPQFRYLNFRVGREPLRVSKSTKFVRLVLKFCFCSLGLWGHQAWNYILRVLFSAICVYQAFFETHLIVGCPLFDCDFNTTEQTHKDDLQTGKTFYLLLSVAAIISYLSFIGCLVAAKRKDSALASPSQSMMDIDSVDVYLLFVAFLFIYTVSSSMALHYRLQNQTIFLTTGVVATCLAHWASVNTCNVFAVCSFALGTFVQDTLRLIRDVQSGALDDVIRIHEDLCTVVFNTVSAYSVWFVLHWFTYGASLLVAAIYISEEILLKAPKVNLVYLGFLFVCLLYLFLLPCVCAAKITSHCAGIYEEINGTTSADWNEGHPFRDRRNIALFISYAKDRRCGFKVGRITFNTSLAWFSFFFGLTALMFHFF